MEDTAEAFIKLLKARKTEGEIINIGSNFEISIKNVLETKKILILNSKLLLKKELEVNQAR